MTNYWIKDESRKQIITKTQISNNGDFELYASYFNLMDAKGLSCHLNKNIDLVTDKLLSKNGFEYLIIQHDTFKEFLVLPNQNLDVLIDKIVSKINSCNKVDNIIDLILNEMN